LPALPAQAKDREMTEDRFKAKITPDGLGKSSKVAVIQVDHAPATLADQVVVRLVGHDLVLGTLPAEVNLAEDAEVAQPLQGTVHRREVDIGLVAQNLDVHPLGAGVALEFTDCLQDENPLARHPAASLAHTACQSL